MYSVIVPLSYRFGDGSSARIRARWLRHKRPLGEDPPAYLCTSWPQRRLMPWYVRDSSYPSELVMKMLKKITADLFAFTVFDAVPVVEIIGGAAGATTLTTVSLGRPST